MNPATHYLSGWLLANTVQLDRRDRAIVTIGAIIPDLDGLGLVVEIATRNTRHPLLWWSDYHHILHNIGFAGAYTLLAIALTRHRSRVGLLALAAFHIHLIGDLLGARGPDGDPWPLPYLLPFSSAWQLAWEGQWALNAWPNFALTGVGLALTFYLAWSRGYSPVEMISPRADAAFVAALRNRFPRRSNPSQQ